MSRDGLSEFAIHSRKKADRIHSSESASNPVQISKFGVGAKNAGFFLGDRIRIVTKKSASKNVFEFTFSQAALEDMHKAGKAYDGTIFPRHPLEVEKHASRSEETNQRLMGELRRHEEGDHFTYLVIHLREHIVDQLLDGFPGVCEELGDTYHFHIHPEHSPPGVLEACNATVAGGGAVRSSERASRRNSAEVGAQNANARPISSDHAAALAAKLTGTTITLSKITEGEEWPRVRLGHPDQHELIRAGAMQLAFDKCKGDKFYFCAEIPKPPSLMSVGGLVSEKRR